MEFRGPRNAQPKKEQLHRINEQNRANTVRLVGDDMEPGVYSLKNPTTKTSELL